jgi:uncharacterized integral membrane protein (TIGR00697 family)
MIETIIRDRPTRLFLGLSAFFVTNALIAEFIGVKIFSFEKLWGLAPLNLSLLGQKNLAFNLTAGVLLWPFVFVMTDIINEYFGKRAVRFLSFLTVAMIAYAFVMFGIGIQLPPADFWPPSMQTQGIPDMNQAFRGVFGQGLWIIIGSIIAFLVGQIIDVTVFQRLKRLTGEKALWLRATGSTLVSQLIDSYVVLFVAFYLGANWSLPLVLAIGTVNYIYKFSCALLLTPVIYGAHVAIDRYLGAEMSEAMRKQAMNG